MIPIDDILKRTLLYKVGHHGSHNSTLKNWVRLKDRTSPPTPYGLEQMDDIISMITVDHAAVSKSMPRPWKMPYSSLYKRLRTKSSRRILRADQKTAPLSSSAKKDVVPTSKDWTEVPGKSHLKWRRSEEEFELLEGSTKGPLYFELRIPVTS